MIGLRVVRGKALLLVLWLLCSVTGFSRHPLAEEVKNDIVVNYREGSPDIVMELDLLTMRSVVYPEPLVSEAQPEKSLPKGWADIGFSAKLLTQAALTVPEIARKYGSQLADGRANYTEITQVMGEARHALLGVCASCTDQISSLSSGQLYLDGRITRESIDGVDPISGILKTWDPVSLILVGGSGLLDNRVLSGSGQEADDPTYQYWQIRKNLKSTVDMSFYSWHEGGSLIDERARTRALLNSINNLRADHALEGSLLEKVGKIQFGKPVVWRADEKKLVIPESITRTSEVLWIEFPVNIQLFGNREIEKIYAQFSLPDGFLALDLAPQYDGVEVTEETKLNTPEIGVKTNIGEVSIGEIFGKTVGVKYLRPTVFASGLGMQEFSWTIFGEAVRAGAHRFVGVIEVPRGSNELEIVPSGSVDLLDTWTDSGASFDTNDPLLSVKALIIKY